MNFTDLPVYRAMFRLHLYIDRVLNNYPKKYYYTIGKTISKINIDIIVCLHKLATVQHREKTKLFRRIFKKINEFKFYLRLSFEYKILKTKQMTYIFKELINVEKQIYLWEKSLEGS